MRLLCAAYTVLYSLRSINPLSPMGWLPVSGHDYEGDPWESIVCARCGDVG